MMNFTKNGKNEYYYKLKEQHHWDNCKYYGSLATAHVEKGFIHDILFEYYSMRERLSYKKYRKFLEKQWKDLES
jgi:hypothetical protein